MNIKDLEFVGPNGITLRATLNETTGETYFSVLGLGKCCGLSNQECRDLKKKLLSSEKTNHLLELRPVHTKPNHIQDVWTVKKEDLPQLVQRENKLNSLKELFEESVFLSDKKMVLEDFNSCFPTLKYLKSINIRRKNMKINTDVVIREFKIRVSIRALSQIFGLSDSYLVEYITEEVSLSSYYDESYDDCEHLILFHLANRKIENRNLFMQVVESIKDANEFLVKEVYKKVVIELNDNLYQVYAMQNIENGLIRVGISHRINKRLVENSGGGQIPLSLIYLSPPISNAMDIKQKIVKEISMYKVVGDWFNISDFDFIRIVKKKIEEDMEIFKPNF